ncbi:hypothetical protein GLAREA_07906 [Glarea lozoyensis ATCC 20868]|uniref:Uncharacterized protein n=1 Tax=Glarea lozoyensis (strain ATCC 20868 / MF5171) TaxID=1116229 RepID=S3D2Q0_GLAL2|nr:uncharacterized protein GLAREA_07906 [Glarea lozoyensis ATCC 20868]EPE32772.1 hypothetical protein GLAREA_07906 [Glarea lozoyensis ATCC 20868]
MARDPTGKTLQSNYDNVATEVDVSAIGLVETMVDFSEQSHAILQKFYYTLDATEIEKVLQEAIHDDIDYQGATTAEERLRYAKSARLREQSALRDYFREEFANKVTTPEFRNRISELKTPSKHAGLDTGDILGVQVSDDVENSTLSVDHHNNNFDMPTITTNTGNGPNNTIRTDIPGANLEEGTTITYA